MEETAPAAEPTVDPAAEQAAKDEAARQEQEKSTFATDYESEPLLNTTSIKYLSLEVGGTDDEIRLNWMSPSGKRRTGKLVYRAGRDISDGDGPVQRFPDYAWILCKQSDGDRTAAGNDLCV